MSLTNSKKPIVSKVLTHLPQQVFQLPGMSRQATSLNDLFQSQNQNMINQYILAQNSYQTNLLQQQQQQVINGRSLISQQHPMLSTNPSELLKNYLQTAMFMQQQQQQLSPNTNVLNPNQNSVMTAYLMAAINANTNRNNILTEKEQLFVHQQVQKPQNMCHEQTLKKKSTPTTDLKK